MATQLKGTIKRAIHVHGVSAPINVSITQDGIDLAVAGMKSRISISWPSIVGHCQTPNKCPSFLFGKPLEFLKAQAASKAK